MMLTMNESRDNSNKSKEWKYREEGHTAWTTFGFGSTVKPAQIYEKPHSTLTQKPAFFFELTGSH